MSRLILVVVLLAYPLALAFSPAAAADKKDDSKGWEQLFNGTDLKGWKTHPDDKAKWEVKDGAIVASGPPGLLFSERNDYENFHLRIEARINDKGDSGLLFRAQYGKTWPKGYEAQININPKSTVKTGSLYYGFNPRLTDEEKKKITVREAKHKADEWFTYEVIADGNYIIIKVNGKTTVDFLDDNFTYTKGHFAIQQNGADIMVRKAGVKRLPPSKK
jgi:hypothetical protein